MTRPTIDMDYTVLDCPDPVALGRFYTALLGWKVVQDDPDWTVIEGTGGSRLAFQKAPDFVPLYWPREGIRIHLDLVVDDMEAAQAFAVEQGARVLDEDGEHPGFRVLQDPVGHLFCLCRRD
ncbi:MULTISPECIES: VOC family protein [Nocardiaceae]|uniref:Enzyme related to lactoylglutathione lyase n=1 Tax=Rhodococcoides corynebacterioides TaxID=53972 RepID=A0ABS2KPV6_9NOCA|nr:MULTISPECIES: VOC family protein [Rhodococcus]MBM7413993.1 putative enzyme related to lactoylglutathione lyase [Rhodococcus corynebacterioides]MBP1116456.1 putative enzyme related to lactoylglutathione lyase [Rhodococcus sp. PvP016]